VPDRRRASLQTVVTGSAERARRAFEQLDDPLRVAAAPRSVRAALATTRRAGAELGAVAGLLEGHWVEETVAELAWLEGLLSARAEADRLASLLASGALEPARRRGLDDGDGGERRPVPGGQTAGVDALVGQVATRRRTTTALLRAGLRDQRYGELLERLAAAAAAPAWRTDGLEGWDVDPSAPARPVLRRAVRAHWEQLAARVAALPRRPAGGELDGLLAGAGQLADVAGLAAPVAGRRAKAVALRSARLAKHLDEHLSRLAAADWLALRAVDPELCGSAREGLVLAFTAGQCVERLYRSAARLARRWPEDLAELQAACAGSWIVAARR